MECHITKVIPNNIICTSNNILSGNFKKGIRNSDGFKKQKDLRFNFFSNFSLLEYFNSISLNS